MPWWSKMKLHKATNRNISFSLCGSFIFRPSRLRSILKAEKVRYACFHHYFSKFFRRYFSHMPNHFSCIISKSRLSFRQTLYDMQIRVFSMLCIRCWFSMFGKMNSVSVSNNEKLSPLIWIKCQRWKRREIEKNQSVKIINNADICVCRKV